MASAKRRCFSVKINKILVPSNMKVDDFCEQNNTNLTCYDTSQAWIDVEYRIQAGV